MTTEENKSYAEKNEERVERAVDKLEDKLAGNDKEQESKSKKAKNKQ